MMTTVFFWTELADHRDVVCLYINKIWDSKTLNSSEDEM